MYTQSDIIDISLLTSISHANTITELPESQIKNLISSNSTPFLLGLPAIISYLRLKLNDEEIMAKLKISEEVLDNLTVQIVPRKISKVVTQYEAPCKICGSGRVYINIKEHLRTAHFYDKQQKKEYIEANGIKNHLHEEKQKQTPKTASYPKTEGNYIQCYVCLRDINKRHWHDHAICHLGGYMIFCDRCNRYMNRDKYKRHMKMRHCI
ncbi:unnamed protein product [Blepharisma stoltei]|uniref:C2H2-type domain-containing protein n=1 Tax=Blepharisma stoltei TaxID=1481888 RepID=A0AAU9KAI7_9CILI|nr:unnamed protein product [Blepharisma stoltei]